MKIQLETASIEFAHNYFERHETNNYKALKQGFQEGAKWQQEQDKNKHSEGDKIMSFLDTEYKLGISDKKTIERLKWYFETYFEQFKKK
jgi:hypothetical protein